MNGNKLWPWLQKFLLSILTKIESRINGNELWFDCRKFLLYIWMNPFFLVPLDSKMALSASELLFLLGLGFQHVVVMSKFWPFGGAYALKSYTEQLDCIEKRRNKQNKKLKVMNSFSQKDGTHHTWMSLSIYHLHKFERTEIKCMLKKG